MNKIGLVLSGGGARCVAHIGVLKAMEEKGLKPSYISATSGGAIVGSMFAAGHSADEILERYMKSNMLRKARPSMKGLGLIEPKSIVSLLSPHFTEDSFEHLSIPLIVNAVDVLQGQTVYFDSGPLFSRVAAACCLPFIFAPMKEGEMLLADGGILQNLPVQPLQNKGLDYLIGVHVNPYPTGKALGGMKDNLERAALLAIGHNTKDSRGLLDLFIEPAEMSRFRGYEYKATKEMFQIGYEAGKEAFARMGE